MGQGSTYFSQYSGRTDNRPDFPVKQNQQFSLSKKVMVLVESVLPSMTLYLFIIGAVTFNSI